MVHKLGYTNSQAHTFIKSGKVCVDGITVHENCFIEDKQEITIDGLVVRPSKRFVYLKFNKPRGFQSSLNSNVPDNIAGFFKNMHGLAIAGRLDKESEGLLLLSNDGKWVEKICNPESQKEKEYKVELNKDPDPEFFMKFQDGLLIGKHLTRPCICERISENTIKVILTEGKNRQIRRMVNSLGYDVLSLKRLKVDIYKLDDLKSGEIKIIST